MTNAGLFPVFHAASEIAGECPTCPVPFPLVALGTDIWISIGCLSREAALALRNALADPEWRPEG